MNFCKYLATAAMCVSLTAWQPAHGQTPVAAGAGSYASAPPFYKAKTTPGGPGFNATAMLSREIFADELPARSDGAIDVPGRPIPTNDWWTDIINNRYSGALWSYPAMLRTGDDGLQISFPSYWADAGKEMKSRTSITVSASRFRAAAAIAADWHDWDVVFRMPAASGDGEMRVTAAHGSPFTWVEYTAVAPEINVGADAVLFGTAKGRTGVRVDGDLYGVYYAEGAECRLAGGKLQLNGATAWLAVALLRTETDLEAFAPYAASVPRRTQVEWTYEETTGKVNSTWTVTAENLRDASATAPVLQGFLPHAYKYALPGASFSFMDEDGFETPRGRMKLATAANGTFSYAYRFSGMLPGYGAPAEGNTEENAYSSEVMDALMRDYAERGSFGGDTYWGGKGLVQMAMNMCFAKQTGNTALYEKSRARLTEAFENWLTYTPGEDTFFFSYYPRWGAMLGFDVSYDSDAFNDHHFHYGYFTYAAALLCLEDKEFATKYGELLTMIAKDYANWDREDGRFPFMRTLDPWCGHSWAGGLGDHGNDNGNGQESTSEAMQSWGGLYLLGVALDNKPMRDAGIWGWSTEARATREYWYDVDAPRPANAGGRKPWAGKGDRRGNYHYDEYPYAYNSNITGKGIGWWTWFGGDPLFMHGIQWMPVSPALDYLSWDPDFVGWAYDDMMSGANSTFSHKWFETTYNSDNGDAIEPLAGNDWGNVALAYMERHNPAEAARIFDEALARKMHIATAVSTAHISYYIIHSHLTYGDPDFSIHADVPTAQVRVKNGTPTYLVYNPGAEDRTVRFFNESGAVVKTVTAPAGRLAAICADPEATEIAAEVDGGCIIPPGGKSTLDCRVLDQYGAVMKGADVAVGIAEGAKATYAGGELSVGADAARGTQFVVSLTHGDITTTLTITVNDRPAAQCARIEGVPQVSEKGVAISASFITTDQYGAEATPADTHWTLTDADGYECDVEMPLTPTVAGNYTIKATSAQAGKEASARVFVTPPMPDISTGCGATASSAENGGMLPAGATDGSEQTRWGSRHSDDEWLMADLGEDCLISRIDILWEAAFASRYELQTASDGCEMTDVTVNYGGQQHTARVPAESAWTTAATESASGAGHRESIVGATGRYVRMKGVERGSAYGYSIYEMSIYGLRGSLAEDAVLGVDFALPECLDCGRSAVLEPKVHTRSGSIVADAVISWGADKPARFAGNTFTPLSAGRYTVTARLADGSSSAGATFVNDVERAVAVSLDKDNYATVPDMPAMVPFRVMNQFLAPYSGGADGLAVRVLDADGAPAENAAYDAATMLFTATACGSYTIDFGGMAKCAVAVKPLGEMNLALGKTAWDSSHENDGLAAAYAVDGRHDTRWGSKFNDGEWMTVDLGSVFELSNIKIYWNNPAYATHYTVATSLTGYDDDFTDLATRSDYRHTPDAEVVDAAGREARYVRVAGLKRATGYGVSVDELEVYGSRIVSGIADASRDVSDGEVRWYTLQGLRVAQPSEAGVYIRVRGARAEKVLIR